MKMFNISMYQSIIIMISRLFTIIKLLPALLFLRSLNISFSDLYLSQTHDRSLRQKIMN